MNELSDTELQTVEVTLNNFIINIIKKENFLGQNVFILKILCLINL